MTKPPGRPPRLRLRPLIAAASAALALAADASPAATHGRSPPPTRAYHLRADAVDARISALAASPRVRISTLGTTPGGRAIHEVVLSSPRNLANLDAIRSDLAELADPRVPVSGGSEADLIARLPAIVWLNFSIHGDESAGTEAAVQVLDSLAGDPSLEPTLESVVVVVHPCVNPDGRERFVTWFESITRGRPETWAAEKRQPWAVSGRFNGAGFDLNRDLVAVTQRESRDLVASYRKWNPHVVADLHGETREYFFPPAAAPIHPALQTAGFAKWQEIFGRANAAAFDHCGWLYFVRDVFDLFYAGYWDSWTSLQGAIGMTYETTGGGDLGALQYRDDGTTVTLADAVAQHVVASLETVRTAAAHREGLLRHFRAFRKAAISTPASGRTHAYLFPPGGDPGRRAALLESLSLQGIEVAELTAPVTLDQVKGPDGTTGRREFAAGTWVVMRTQPQGALTEALLAPEPRLDDAFLADQERIRARNQRRGSEVPSDDYGFYDLTAWSLPQALGIETASALSTLPDSLQTAPPAPPPPPAANAPARVGYAWSPDSDGAFALALHLLAGGHRVSASRKPLNAGGTSLPAGTFLAFTSRNNPDLTSAIGTAAAHHRVALLGIDSAFADEGSTGVGGDAVFPLRSPRIAVLAGPPARYPDFGALAFFLERQAGVGFVPVDPADLEDVPWAEVDMLLLPDGNADGYRRLLDKALGSYGLRRWLEAGGILVTFGNASIAAADPDLLLTTSRQVTRDGEGPDAEITPIPGGFFAAEPDPDSFLAWGLRSAAHPVLLEGDAFLGPSSTGNNVLRIPTDRSRPWHLSGHVWPDETEDVLRGACPVIDEPVTSGRVVLAAAQPGWRGFVRSYDRAVLAALAYGPGLSRAASQGY